MTKANYTHIQLLVDRSGSMASIRDDAEGGINTLIEDQKAVEGFCTLGITEFDDKYEVPVPPKDIANVGKYALHPRGSTALLDAIGRCITETGAWLANMDENDRPSLVLFAVVTDGMENASREWTHEKVMELITEHTDKYGWDFKYLAAGQDAIQVGAQMGFRASNSMSYDNAKVGSTYDTLSTNMVNTRLMGKPQGFTEEDRKTVK